MSRDPVVVLPAEAADKIRASTDQFGRLRMTHSAADNLYVISTFQSGSRGGVLPVRPAKGQERLRQQSAAYAGEWRRVDLAAHWHHYRLSNRPGTCLPLDAFNTLLPDQVQSPRNGSTLLITHAPDVLALPQPHPLREFAAWTARNGVVAPYDLAVEPATYGLSQLAAHWPLDVLQGKAVLVVGVGSIGSAVASNLAAYGVGTLHLLDPDRLLWHNVVRHVLGSGEIGRFKTDALSDALGERWPGLNAMSHVLDVVSDADRVRVLLQDVHAVVCAADGIAPRRVVSHLARRAGVDAILTSVLEDGAYGEVLRLRPAPDHGCMLCRRAVSYEQGEMDPERVQERGYGDGDPHRPMTAVGPDLALMGALAAKATVASMLQRAGHNDQRLPGEQAIVALRPQPGFSEPFDLKRTADVRWHPASPPRQGCPTCTGP